MSTEVKFMFRSLPPAWRSDFEGYVFTGICLSNLGGGGRWATMDQYDKLPPHIPPLTRSQHHPPPPRPSHNTSLPPPPNYSDDNTSLPPVTRSQHPPTPPQCTRSQHHHPSPPSAAPPRSRSQHPLPPHPPPPVMAYCGRRAVRMSY